MWVKQKNIFLFLVFATISSLLFINSPIVSAAPTAGEARQACQDAGVAQSDLSACTSGYMSKDCSTLAANLQSACANGKALFDKTAPTPAPAPAPVRGGTPAAAPAPAPAPTTPPQDDGTTCAVEMIGWILCPVIQGVATMSDKVFDLLAGNFLQVEAELLNENNGIKGPWDASRNIANVLFIIAFIIIIYSQITGAGISNYGIKKMLPRLITAALLVNISFYICQAMVDLSNILGYNIYEFLKASAASIGPSAMADIPGNDTVTGGGLMTVLAVAILAAATLVWLLLAPLGAIALMVLITCVTIVIILLLRKAFIVLLVVASPIAFVAYLLPNTEKYFSKWLSMFWQLLMVFPVVALLLGGGQLASTIIMVAGSSGAAPPSTQQCNPDDPANQSIPKQNNGYSAPCEGAVIIPGGPDGDMHVGWMLGLVAAGIAVAPLLAVWAVLKGALAAAGAIGGKIANSVQKGTAGAGNGMANKYKNSNLGKYRASQKEQKMGRVSTGSYAGSNPLLKARSRVNRKLNRSGAFNKATSGFGAGRDLLAQAQDSKDMKDTEAFFNHDDGLMKAWLAQSSDGLDPAQAEQYNRMKNSGMAKKPVSFLAAAEGLSDSGKGSAKDITNALKQANSAGASNTAVSSAFENAKANYRKSGRGDALGELEHIGATGGGAVGIASGAKSYENMVAAAREIRDSSGAIIGRQSMRDSKISAWSQVTPQSTHREGIKDSSYSEFLNSNKNNVEKALQAYNGMEGRAQEASRDLILAAAQAHNPTAGGYGTIQDAKTAYNIK